MCKNITFATLLWTVIKHSRRMCTTCLQTVVLQWQPSDVAGGGSGPQVKKVKQVSIDYHQMSLAGGWSQVGGVDVSGLMSGGLGPGDGAVRSNTSWVMVT